jgi:hypothetical protein
MAKLLVILTAFICSATLVYAEGYRCEITSYGKPTNFRGSINEQNEAMQFWLPPEEFWLVEENNSMFLHMYSDEKEIEAENVRKTSTRRIFDFNNSPNYGSGSWVREYTLTLFDADLAFSIELELRRTRYLVGKGSAKGQCVIDR